jgi:hypothetical protein
MNPVIDTDGHVFETNYVYSVAEPDGTALGLMFPSEQDLVPERGEVQCRAGPWPSPLFSAVYLAQERFRSFVSAGPFSGIRSYLMF